MIVPILKLILWNKLLLGEVARLPYLILFVFIDVLRWKVLFLLYVSENGVDEFGEFEHLLFWFVDSMVKGLNHFLEIQTYVSIHVLRLVRSLVFVAEFSDDRVDLLLENVVLVTQIQKRI